MASLRYLLIVGLLLVLALTAMARVAQPFSDDLSPLKASLRKRDWFDRLRQKRPPVHYRREVIEALCFL